MSGSLRSLPIFITPPFRYFPATARDAVVELRTETLAVQFIHLTPSAVVCYNKNIRPAQLENRNSSSSIHIKMR